MIFGRDFLKLKMARLQDTTTSTRVRMDKFLNYRTPKQKYSERSSTVQGTDQVEAVQFLEKRLKESRKLAGEKCEEIRKALNIKAESDGEPPVKKQRFGPSNEIDEENGNVLRFKTSLVS